MDLFDKVLHYYDEYEIHLTNSSNRIPGENELQYQARKTIDENLANESKSE